MLNLPNIGDRVRVWPAAGLNVQNGDGAFCKFLPSGGREVAWDSYWHRRLLDGAIHLHDPSPATAPAKE